MVGRFYPHKNNRLDLTHYAPDLATLVDETLGEFELNATCQRANSRSQGATLRQLVSGSTVDADGEAIQDYGVHLRQASTGEVAARAAARPDGSFRAYVAPGEYVVGVAVEGCHAVPEESAPTTEQEPANVLVVESLDLEIELRLAQLRC